MLRVNEYVNTVQNDTSNGWDDGATDDGSSSQPEPGSYASTWDMLIAGDIDGLYEKASYNPILSLALLSHLSLVHHRRSMNGAELNNRKQMLLKR